MRNYKKGDEVEAMVLSIDVEKERISLGIKQMEGDPFTNFVATHDKNSIVKGTVKSVDPARCRDRSGRRRRRLPARFRGLARSRRGSAQLLKEGDTVEAMIINVDRKIAFASTCRSRPRTRPSRTRRCRSCRPSSSAASGTTNLGALLKAKLNNHPQR